MEGNKLYERVLSLSSYSYIIQNEKGAVNPDLCGTKMAAHYTLDVPAGGEQYIRLRLTDYETNSPFNNFDAIIDRRRKEADVFYDALLGDKLSPAQVNIARQCYAGKSSTVH